MNHRPFGGSTLIFALLVAGCSFHDNTASGGAGGGQATGGAGGSGGGTVATGGTSGSGTGTGGMSGGSGGAASCSDVSACGGDVVGTWTVSSSCLKVSGTADMQAGGLACPTAAVTGTLQVTGTLTLNSDGTYTDDTHTTGNSRLDVPAACKELSGTTFTCDRLGGPMQALGYASVDCVDAASGGGCTCTATVDQNGGLGVAYASPPTSGNYTTADNAITISGGNTDVLYPYCVSGTTLTVTPPTKFSGTVTGAVVLQK